MLTTSPRPGWRARVSPSPKRARSCAPTPTRPSATKPDFVAHVDQTLVGWRKFPGDGEPPAIQHMGILYDGFAMPARASLGDTDESAWPIGLSGRPEDPWQHVQLLVLENATTHEMFTFVTSSKTGRRAVGNLIRHYDRMHRTDAAFYPLVRLKTGGFKHSDERVGWVHTPVFQVIGRIPARRRHSEARRSVVVSRRRLQRQCALLAVARAREADQKVSSLDPFTTKQINRETAAMPTAMFDFKRDGETEELYRPATSSIPTASTTAGWPITHCLISSTPQYPMLLPISARQIQRRVLAQAV